MFLTSLEQYELGNIQKFKQSTLTCIKFKQSKSMIQLHISKINKMPITSLKMPQLAGDDFDDFLVLWASICSIEPMSAGVQLAFMLVAAMPLAWKTPVVYHTYSAIQLQI
jgi:hypothetical protein